MPIHTQRGITMPAVLIILLLATSVSGWGLYYKNVSDSQAELSKQTGTNKQLQLTIERLKASQNSANHQIETLTRQTRTLQDEITAKRKLQANCEQVRQAHFEQANACTQTLSDERDKSLRHIREITTALDNSKKALAQSTSEHNAARRQIAALTRQRDAALASDKRARGQLAELILQMESSQRDSATYREQLDAAHRELDTTSEQANILSQRLQALKAEREKEQQAFNQLREKLNRELGKNSVNIEQKRNQPTIIRLQDDVLFNSGSAQLLAPARTALTRIGDVLQQYPQKRIEIEGHTDNTPIVGSIRYPTNWELSAARASSAVRFLINNSTITPQRLQATGRGEYSPLANNATAGGRARNRRIEIKLLPTELVEVTEKNVGN